MSFFFNDELNVNGTTIDSTEIGFLDGVSAGTAQANKALVISSLPSSSSKVLQSTTGGELTWEPLPTINNNADNNLITGSSTSNELNGEANLTYDGTTLSLNDTLRIAQTGSGLRMTNVGAFDNDGSNNFRIFSTNDLILCANGDTNTAVTIDSTNRNVSIHNNMLPSITNTSNLGSSSLKWYDIYLSNELTINTSTVNSNEIGYLDGVFAGTAQANKALVISSLPSSGSQVLQSTTGGVLSWVTMSGGSSITINNNTNNNLVTATGSSSELNGETNLTFDGSTLNVTGSISVDTSITLDSTTINATEIGYLDSVTAGTAAANKALVISSLPSSDNQVLKSTSGGVLSWGTSETRSTTNLNFIAEPDNFYTIYSSNSIVVILPEITSSNQGNEICFALVEKTSRNVQFYPSIGSNQKFLDDYGVDSSSISNSNSTVEILKYKSIFYTSDGVTFSISNNGSNYSSGDYVSNLNISGGGGSGSSFNINFRTGVVQSVTINNGGSGYSNDDFLYFSNGTGFQGRLIVNSSGVITDVIILDGGYNYSSSDFAFSSTPSGSGANITLNVSGVIPVITSQFSGSSYTSVPTISFDVLSEGGVDSSGSDLAVTGTLNKGLWVPIINTGTT